MSRPAVLTGAVAGLVLLAGCGVGQDPVTYSYRANAESTDGNVGGIAVRAASVRPPADGTAYEEGGQALVDLTIVNGASLDDALVSASSPAAESVDIAGAPSPLVVQAGTTAQPGYNLVLRGLNQELRTAQYVDLTLEFEQSGSVTVNIPVRTTGEEPEEVEYDVPEIDSEGDPVPQEGPEGGVEGGSGPDSTAG